MITMTIALLLSATDESGCYAANRAIDAEEIVVRDDVAEVPCQAQDTALLLRSDPRSGRVEARVAIEKHAYLGRVWIPDAPVIERGDSVQVIARIGAVEVRREVTALQRAVEGQSFFVMDADGKVFVAPPVAALDGNE